MDKLTKLYNDYRVISITHDADSKAWIIELSKITNLNKVVLEYTLKDAYLNDTLSLVGFKKPLSSESLLTFMLSKYRKEVIKNG